MYVRDRGVGRDTPFIMGVVWGSVSWVCVRERETFWVGCMCAREVSVGTDHSVYEGISLIRNRHPVGPYSRTMPRVLGGS